MRLTTVQSRVETLEIQVSSKPRSFKSTDANRLKDEATRELLFRVLQYIETTPILSFGMQFLEKEFTAAGTIEVQHSLGFIPKDVILTSKIGVGTVVFNYADFTKSTISVTVSAPCSIRILYGTYRSE